MQVSYSGLKEFVPISQVYINCKPVNHGEYTTHPYSNINTHTKQKGHGNRRHVTARERYYSNMSRGRISYLKNFKLQSNDDN